LRYFPNLISAARIAVTPVLLALLMTETLWSQAAALGLFMLVAASDYVDGVVARSYGASSRIGKFLDPLADKVLVLSLLIALAILEPATVPWWAVLIIALRDVAVTGLRTWSKSHRRNVPTLRLAKLKTALQLFFLFLMLLLIVSTKVGGTVEQSGRWMLHSYIPYLLLLTLVGITVYTGWQYFYPREQPARRKR
jgi:CDP-diacylglycerol--glycerol-3-phosphate 3-phosphatidyltransferase